MPEFERFYEPLIIDPDGRWSSEVSVDTSVSDRIDWSIIVLLTEDGESEVFTGKHILVPMEDLKTSGLRTIKIQTLEAPKTRRYKRIG